MVAKSPRKFVSSLVLRAYSKGKRVLNAAVGIDHWTLHDLRRTAATGMARLGVEPHVVECILNHSTGTFGGVAGVYNRYRYLDQMSKALKIWEAHVCKLLITYSGELSKAEKTGAVDS